MDIRELKYFIQIADSASYSSAAEKLYISQPALSKVIQKMEEELGYDLFFNNIELKNLDYVQIHPTTLYSDNKEERSFLISESVRGEGARLYDKNMNRFVDELLPRDLLTQEIYKQMEKDGTDFVWEDLRTIPRDELISHFPNIIEHCSQAGYDVFHECIPIVPAQHYFMGGIKVNHNSKTSMDHLYAVGETACNGVHGKNRLASNSLLESLVFAKRAAKEIAGERR